MWRAGSYDPQLEPLWRWLIINGDPYVDKPRSGPEPEEFKEYQHHVDLDSQQRGLADGAMGRLGDRFRLLRNYGRGER